MIIVSALTKWFNVFLQTENNNSKTKDDEYVKLWYVIIHACLMNLGWNTQNGDIDLHIILTSDY